MPQLWEWLPDLNWTHEVSRRFPVPPDSTTWATPQDQDLKPPQRIMTFRAHGMTAVEVNAILTAMATRGATYTLTDKFGVSFTGTPLSITSPPINGALNPLASAPGQTPGLFDAILTMRMPT